MRLFRYTRGEERHFLDSSFERHGDGYAFYRHHFARGVPVSVQEREAYLRPPVGASRREFHEAIRGRPAILPRRSWSRSQRATLAGIPAAFGFGLILLGASLIWRGSGLEPPLRWLLLGAGGLGSVYGVFVLAVRLLPGEPGEGLGGQPSAPRRFGCRRYD